MKKSTLKSRKFWAVVSAALAVTASALAGQIGWEQASWQLVALALGYAGVEGAVDLSAIGVAPAGDKAVK